VLAAFLMADVQTLRLKRVVLMPVVITLAMIQSALQPIAQAQPHAALMMALVLMSWLRNAHPSAEATKELVQIVLQPSAKLLAQAMNALPHSLQCLA